MSVENTAWAAALLVMSASSTLFSGVFRMGAYPSSQKVEGTVALSALFLQLGWEGVTDFATGGLAARSSVQSVTVPPKGLLMPMSVPGTLSPLSGEVPLRTTLLRPPLLPVGPTASGTVETLEAVHAKIKTWRRGGGPHKEVGGKGSWQRVLEPPFPWPTMH